MPDFFDIDEIVKSYDGTIVKRIFSYVKPYGGLLAVATLTLALSTAGEPMGTPEMITEQLDVPPLCSGP